MLRFLTIVILFASQAAFAQFRGYELGDSARDAFRGTGEYMQIASTLRERAEQEREQARQLEKNGQSEAAQSMREEADLSDRTADSMVSGAAAAQAK